MLLMDGSRIKLKLVMMMTLIELVTSKSKGH